MVRIYININKSKATMKIYKMSFLKDEEKDHLENIAHLMVFNDKGILAADESTNTIGKRFDSIKVENNLENRRKYRELLFTTPDLNKYIGGVILYKETFEQSTVDGKHKFIDILKDQGICVGIKLDEGLVSFKDSSHIEQSTQGLLTLSERAEFFKQKGADFAKWRCVYRIDEDLKLPSEELIVNNAKVLAEYALICQIIGLVPIIEPEVLMEGSHSLEKCQKVTKRVLSEVIYQLHKQDVYLPGIVLKPNMVLPGKDYVFVDTDEADFLIEDIAHGTIDVLVDTIPTSIPGIAFLSGGQSSELAIDYLKEINSVHNYAPWALTFSYGRGLQENVLKAWQGIDKNIKIAQDELIKSAESCSVAIKQKSQ